MSRRINPARAKVHFSYSIAELARLFSVHRNTVRGWIRSGLPTFRVGRQVLLLGADVREFLTQRRRSRRTACPKGTMYCLRCRAPRRPAGGHVEFLRQSGATGNLRGICDACGGLMHRGSSPASLARSGFGRSQFEGEDSHLYCSPCSPVHCSSGQEVAA